MPDFMNSKNLKYLLMMMFAPIFVACADTYNIIGTSSQCMFNGKMAYIKHMDYAEMKILDSCEVIHGEFQMCGPLDSVICVSLFMGNSRGIPVVLEKGDISINLAHSSIKVEGTPLNERLYTFLNSCDSLIMLVSELQNRNESMVYAGYGLSSDFVDRKKREAELKMEIHQLETQFIMNNYDNVLGVTWFMELCHKAYAMSRRYVSTPQIDEIYGRAPESFRQNKFVKSYMDMVY